MHECPDCGGAFFEPGQNSDLVQGGCPNCNRPWRFQVPGTADDARLRDMPGIGGTSDDTGGNPLQEGILADNGWKPRNKLDESFASVYDLRVAEHFDIPFETVGIVPPSPSAVEAQHTVTLRIPHGITDNLHKAFGKAKAWVENPYENGALRPYYNGYWKTLRPALSGQGVIRVAIQDPHMAKELQQIANADAAQHEAAFLAPAEVAAAPAEAAAAGAAAGEAGALAGGAASGLGDAATGLWNAVKWPVRINGVGHLMKSIFGGGGGGQQAAPAAQAPAAAPVQNAQFFGSFGDDFDHPSSKPAPHEADDGDSKEHDDGNHELGIQVGDDVNDDGGAATGDEQIQELDPKGHAHKHFTMMIPLLQEYLNSGEDASGDPLVQALHQSLEAEHPGYMEKGDPKAGHELIIMMNGGHKQASPVMTPMPTTGPSLVQPGVSTAPAAGAGPGRCPMGHVVSPADKTCPQCGSPTGGAANMGINALSNDNGIIHGPVTPEEEALQSSSWPQHAPPEYCPNCHSYGQMKLGGCPQCGAQIYKNGEDQLRGFASVGVGPQTKEQQAAVAQYLMGQGRGEEVPNMLIHPEQYADELAQVQGKDSPPQGDAQVATPPEPPVEQTGPGAGMPVPPMQGPMQQMMSAVLRHGADSVAGRCPKCDSHSTRLISQDGDCKCSTCGNRFKMDLINDDGSSTNIEHTAADEIRDVHPNHPDVDAADFIHPEDVSQEQDSGHTWVDEDGDPLKVGSEYEMYSDKYDIPDIVRIDSIKPDAITYTLTGEYGLEHKTELTHQEATMDGERFKKVQQMDVHPEDTGIEQNADVETQTAPGQQSDLSTPHMMMSSQQPLFPPCPGCGKVAGFSNYPFARGFLQCNNCHGLANAKDLAADFNQLTGEHDRGIDSLPEVEHPLGPHTGGAKFTPMEQREFIDEPGVARNSDKLNLEGTHYVSSLDDQFLW